MGLLGTMTSDEKRLYYERCGKAHELLKTPLNELQARYIAERTKQGEECRLKPLKLLATKELPRQSPAQADLGL